MSCARVARLASLPLALVSFLACSCPAVSQAQQTATRPEPGAAVGGKPLIDDGQAQRQLFARFQNLLTGAKLVGMFTIDDQPLDKLHEEQYEIEKVEKQDDGDWWVVTARIKYGDKDLKVPVPLEVKWAGKTPVLTLDNVTIPGFGTFSSRVVLSGDRYAGTWQHDAKGGHLFGKIVLPPQPK
jgi:hypothetical protein